MKEALTVIPADFKDRFPSLAFITILSVTIPLVLCCLHGCGDSSVNPRSQPPVVTNIPGQTITEGESFALISLDEYVNDPDNADSEISWTFTGSDSLTVTADEARIATINLPSNEWNGCDTVLFRATDPAGNTAGVEVIFTVTGINDPPIVDYIPHQIIYESFAFKTIRLDSFVLDHDNTDAELTWSCSGNVELEVSIILRDRATIAVPYDGWTGQETVTFRATDPEGLSGERSVIFEVKPVIHDPLVLDDWPVSTPAEQGMDYDLVHDTYLEAMRIDHLYSLLIIKNGYLVAERYFNGANVDMIAPTASVTKSYTSALTGLALREGHLNSLNQKLADFFPELDWAGTDPGKTDITIRQMLQMRSGYPNEDEVYWDVWMDNWQNLNLLLVIYPLIFEPGTDFEYSNLMAHMLAVILTRASGTDLLSFAQEFLFEPLEYAPVFWPTDPQGYYMGSGNIRIRPRDMARFGMLYLNGGVYKGTQIVPDEWVTESLTTYSQNVFGAEILEYMHNISYGYMWWAAEAGSHDIRLAWGNGGQLIVTVPDLDMIVVTTAENIPVFDPESWPKEKSIVEMVGKFISSQ